MNINTEGENDKKGTILLDSVLQKGQKIHHTELKGWLLRVFAAYGLDCNVFRKPGRMKA